MGIGHTSRPWELMGLVDGDRDVLKAVKVSSRVMGGDGSGKRVSVLRKSNVNVGGKGADTYPLPECANADKLHEREIRGKEQRRVKNR